MKVIKEGTRHKFKPFRVTHAYCGSVLELAESDLDEAGDPREPNIYTYRCPVCKLWGSVER